ncbi:MAG: hypothetical protein SGJ21_12390 [Alphaproteobacteria bacterium]|nr:hypothetical protein [Alphaproteobacteria bacterium]
MSAISCCVVHLVEFGRFRRITAKAYISGGHCLATDTGTGISGCSGPSDRKQSSTARENLTDTGVELPDELSVTQKRLIDYASPGLRGLLGYA